MRNFRGKGGWAAGQGNEGRRAEKAHLKVETIWRRCAGELPGRWSASSLHSCRKRSIRAEEWSGPCPSKPCGSCSTSPDRCPHLSSPVAKSGLIKRTAALVTEPASRGYIVRQLESSWSMEILYSCLASGVRHLDAQEFGMLSKMRCIRGNGDWKYLLI